MINCLCGGELNLDLEETRKDGLRPVYSCSICNRLMVLQIIGEKPRGWRTKKKLEEREIINNLPF